MSDSIFHIFSDERFLDLTVYQYGYEKCEPLHSYVIIIFFTILFPANEC